MYDDDFRRIAILKRPLNFFFLVFCGIIYQNLLHRCVYIAVSSWKLLFHQFLGHRLVDDLVDWNSGVSVRPSVRTSTKRFSNFHLIWCVCRPRPYMRTSVTSTRSKVKVRELPKLRKVHFSRSISSAISAWSSKLMVGGHSMGPGLQLARARFLNFHPGQLSREFKLRPISIFDEIQMAIFR